MSPQVFGINHDRAAPKPERTERGNSPPIPAWGRLARSSSNFTNRVVVLRPEPTTWPVRLALPRPGRAGISRNRVAFPRGRSGQRRSVRFISKWTGSNIMYTTISERRGGAISPSAAICRPRQDSAEPLWFAVMCRQLWGANASKDLEYALQRNDHIRSDRTCRAWAAGDSPPPVNILLMLQRDHQCGKSVLDYVMAECSAPWWLDLNRHADIGRKVLELTK